jgi:hypothetical protein
MSYGLGIREEGCIGGFVGVQTTQHEGHKYIASALEEQKTYVLLVCS